MIVYIKETCLGTLGILLSFCTLYTSDENEDGTDAEVLKKLKDLSKGASKKKVMKPQPKLDLERYVLKIFLRALLVGLEKT